MPATDAIRLPRTDEVIGFLTDLRRELRFTDLLDNFAGEPIKFSVRCTESKATVPNPSPGTACWSFRGERPGQHLIHFCLSLFKKMKAGADWQGYVSAYAHHELMHACITPRDLKEISEVLKKHSIPFSEYNLFEDARIECKGRKDFGFPMSWLDYEDLTPAKDARGYFFNLIQSKGEDEASLLDKSTGGASWIPRVRDYFFPKATKAHDFDVMLALLKEWVGENPPPPSASRGLSITLSLGGKGNGKGKGEDEEGEGSPAGGGATAGDEKGDLESGLALFVDAETFAALVAIAEAQSGDAGKGAREGADTKSKAASMGERHSIVPVPGCTNDPVIRDHPVREVDLDLATKVSERLDALLAPTYRRERSTHHSKRLSARAFMCGKADFYRRTVANRNLRPIKIAYLIDCSGSMACVGESGDSAIDGGIAIAMGLNKLARRGLVTGHIILHKGDNAARCATYALPLPDEFFTRIPSDGGYEAIEPALKQCSDLLRKADYVFCNTDGHICDAPVDKAALAARGIRPIGLYCGNTALAEPLKEWFPVVLIRPTVLDLLEAIVATVDFTQTRRGSS